MPEEHAPSRGTPAVEGYRGQNTTEPLDAVRVASCDQLCGHGGLEGPYGGAERGEPADCCTAVLARFRGLTGLLCRPYGIGHAHATSL